MNPIFPLPMNSVVTNHYTNESDRPYADASVHPLPIRHRKLCDDLNPETCVPAVAAECLYLCKYVST